MFFYVSMKIYQIYTVQNNNKFEFSKTGHSILSSWKSIFVALTIPAWVSHEFSFWQMVLWSLSKVLIFMDIIQN